MADDSIEEVLNESRVATFIEKFIATLGVFQRYPTDSRLVKEAVQGFFVLMMDIMSPTGRLTFSEFHNHLQVNDEALSVKFQDTPLAGGLVFFMLEHNMSSISFLAKCSRSDLESFFKILAVSPYLLRQNPVKTLEEAGIRGIQVKPMGELNQIDGGEGTHRIVSTEAVEATAVRTLHRQAAAAQLVPEQASPVPDPMEADEPEATDGVTEVMARPEAPGVESDEEDGRTLVMSRPVAKGRPIPEVEKRPLYEGVRPPGTVLLVVMAMLGRQVVDDAKVTILTDPEVSRSTSSQRGASFYLLPGSFKIRVSYDKYSLVYDIELGAEVEEIQMDVNLLDAAQ